MFVSKKTLTLLERGVSLGLKKKKIPRKGKEDDKSRRNLVPAMVVKHWEAHLKERGKAVKRGLYCNNFSLKRVKKLMQE